MFAPRSTRRSGLEASIIKALLHHDGEQAPRGTALILTRYRPTTDDLAALAALKREVPGLALRLSTVHRAKGQQADFVFVMGLSGGLLGFPNAMEDDPVLHMVLPKPEPFAFAEERRLMYVAMTRARRKVWLVAPKDNPSGFLTELMELPGGDVRTLVFTDGQLVEGAHVPHRCPACRTGVIIERSGSYGPFLGCSAFPICQATFKACPRCGSQPFLPDGQVFRCPDKDCGHSLPTCPDCARMIQPRWTGFLVPRDGRYGPFLGCHNWRPGDAGCSRTQRAA